MNRAQSAAAWGKVFDAPRVINGSGRVRFMGVWPSGNIGVKRPDDPDSFGPMTVSPERANPLIKAIERRFTERGSLRLA